MIQHLFRLLYLAVLLLLEIAEFFLTLKFTLILYKVPFEYKSQHLFPIFFIFLNKYLNNELEQTNFFFLKIF